MSETKGWTAERIELLQTYLNQGLSATQIAARLDCGLSRNAVIGMVHRRGLRFARGAGREEAVEQRRETYAAQRHERRHKSEKPDLPRGEAGCFAKHPGKVAPAPQRALRALPVVQDASRTSPKAAPEVHYSEPQNLPLIELDLGQCRYATGFDENRAGICFAEWRCTKTRPIARPITRFPITRLAAPIGKPGIARP